MSQIYRQSLVKTFYKLQLYNFSFEINNSPTPKQTKVGNFYRAKVPSSPKGKLERVQTQKHTRSLRGIA